MGRSDVYYRDPEFFRKQATVDHTVDRLARQLVVPRHGLNIVASARGLVIGPVSVTCGMQHDGAVHDENGPVAGSTICYALGAPTRTGHLIAASWFRDLRRTSVTVLSSV